MNLNDCTIYVFVRNDLPLGQDDIQTDHACFHLGMVVAQTWSADLPGIPWLIAKEKLRTSSIRKLAALCIAQKLAHYLMHDNDVDKENPTALAVMATDEREKEFFRKYPLRKYVGDAAETSKVGLNASPPPNADVAQGSSQGQPEHPVLNGEVAGAEPAVSSKHLGCS